MGKKYEFKFYYKYTHNDMNYSYVCIAAGTLYAYQLELFTSFFHAKLVNCGAEGGGNKIKQFIVIERCKTNQIETMRSTVDFY